ncbi:MAG TPA: M6 family metalloprotease domain-containing protein [Gemmataceae bacterium]|nr:M6 family metalloprotease domain-containing protein [Gemmataceae bacterium]
MPRVLPRFLLGLCVLALGGGLLLADPPAKPGDKPADKPAADKPVSEAPAKPEKKSDAPNLADFKTVETAATTRISLAAPSAQGEPGFLGVQVEAAANGAVVVADVQPDSPAAQADLQNGDVITTMGGGKIGSPDALRALVLSKLPGDKLPISIMRKDKQMELTATIGAPSRPMKLAAPGERAFIGLRLGEAKDGAAVEEVVSGSPAEAAGVKVGDILAKFDGAPFTDPNKLGDTMSSHKPGDMVTLLCRREGKDVELKVKLGSAGGGGFGGGFRWDDRSNYWKKDVYHLAVVPVEYSDAKHSDKVAIKDWQEALFSCKTYNDKCCTGQKVYGSLRDFYQEQSYNQLDVQGKVFDWVQVSKKRLDYSEGTGTGQSQLYTEALDKLYEREGKDALNEFDGVFFMYAGGRVQTTRGGIYWPHKANFAYKGKRWNYFICPEMSGERMADISTPCHEFGHMLGLPDLYARPENPGSEGIGKWCTMSEQLPNGRPQQFSAWCKEQLGWIKPAVIDPTTKQKLILSPVEDSAKECFKVLLRPDGSEYFLLENRRKKGFDSDLPGEGLLIWRVVSNHPYIEESHGIGGPAGPGAYLDMVPYPTQANNAFTPYTTPNSKSELGGGLPVNITNIRKLPDGRITFYVGYEYE